MRLAVVIIGLATCAILLAPDPGASHFKRGRHNAVHAIQLAFCGKSNRACPAGNEAIKVAWCESKLDRRARGGGNAWWGLFQQGEWSRSFGRWAWDPWSQSRSAFLAWRANGFCWTCNRQWPVCGQGLD